MPQNELPFANRTRCLQCGTKVIHSLLFSVLMMAPSEAVAETRLDLPLFGAAEVCADRPDEPDWLRRMDVRAAYKRILIQQIYRVQNLERILETGACACDTRFPLWDAAIQTYSDRYAAGGYWEIVNTTAEYRRYANVLQPRAIPLCKAAGNW